MRLQRTYYEVMGLPRTASSQEIKAKYHDLARQFHPDRAQDKVLAERLFVQINLAYRTLMDSDKRAIYDASLFQSDTRGKTTGPINGSAAKAGNATASQPSKPVQPPAVKINIAETLAKAQTAYMGGDRITAHKLCLDVLKADSRNADAHALVGDIYADQGRKQEALEEYRAAAQSSTSSRLILEKIKRMEIAIAAPPPPPSEASRAIADDVAKMAQAANASQKKGSFLDKLIGRSR